MAETRWLLEHLLTRIEEGSAEASAFYGPCRVVWRRLEEPGLRGERDVLELVMLDGGRVKPVVVRTVVGSLPTGWETVEEPRHVLLTVCVGLRQRPTCTRCGRPISDTALLYGDGEHCDSCTLMRKRGLA